MWMKKQYDRAEIEAWKEAGSPPESTPKPTHVRVDRSSKIQKFNQGFIDREIQNGILSIGARKLTFKTVDGQPDLVYKILTIPGIYCCHCNAKQPDSNTAKAHVAAEHAGIPSPDVKPCGAGISGNPAGYRQDNFFTCELEG